MYYNAVHSSTEIHSVVVNLLLVWLTRGHARSGSLVSIIRSGAHACISVCVVFCPVWLENSSSPLCWEEEAYSYIPLLYHKPVCYVYGRGKWNLAVLHHSSEYLWAKYKHWSPYWVTSKLDCCLSSFDFVSLTLQGLDFTKNGCQLSVTKKHL